MKVLRISNGCPKYTYYENERTAIIGAICSTSYFQYGDNLAKEEIKVHNIMSGLNTSYIYEDEKTGALYTSISALYLGRYRNTPPEQTRVIGDVLLCFNVDYKKYEKIKKAICDALVSALERI